MKINIKGTKYKIKEVDSLGCDWGITDSEKHEIYILKDCYNNKEKYKTIFHELLHAYLNECGLFRYSRDENLIDWLDNHILELINRADSIYKKFEKK